MIEGEHSDVSAVVDVVAPDDGVAVVLHPNPREGIVADLIIFIYALGQNKSHSQTLCLC